MLGVFSWKICFSWLGEACLKRSSNGEIFITKLNLFYVLDRLNYTNVRSIVPLYEQIVFKVAVTLHMKSS